MILVDDLRAVEKTQQLVLAHPQRFQNSARSKGQTSCARACIEHSVRVQPGDTDSARGHNTDTEKYQRMLMAACFIAWFARLRGPGCEIIPSTDGTHGTKVSVKTETCHIHGITGIRATASL